MNYPIDAQNRIGNASKYVTGLLLGLTVLLGAMLRFYGIGESGYWYDEVIMVHVAQQDLSALVEDFPAMRPPLYVVLAHFWVEFLGTGEAATRSLSALIGVASIVFLYLLGREMFDRRVGIISAFLMSISEFQIWYSQDFRYYPLMVLMTLLSFLFYVRALKGGRRLDWGLYSIASILLFYTHYLGLLVIVAQGLYFVLRWSRQRRDLVPWLIAQAVILVSVGASVLSFLPSTVTGTVEPMKETVAPSLWSPLVTAAKFIFSGRYDLSQTALAIIITVAIAYLAITITLFAVRRGPRQWLMSAAQLRNRVSVRISRDNNRLILLLCWFLCPLILLFLVSVIFGPIYRHKYVIGAAPALYLLLAYGIITIRRVVPEIAVLGLIVILTLPGLQRYYATEPQEQWREVAAYIQERSNTNDVIIFPIFDHLEQPRGFPLPSLHLTFDWYYQGDLATCDATLQFVEQNARVFYALTRCLAGHEDAWLIMYDTPDAFHEMLRQPGTLQGATRSLILVDTAEFTEIAVYRVRLEDQTARQVGR
jgi:mannosyltransferase